MRNLETITRDIERCKEQIAFTMTANYQHENKDDFMIIRQGFQKHLKNLLDEKSLFEIEVQGETIVFNKPRYQHDGFKKRALETCYSNIQQVTQRAT